MSMQYKAPGDDSTLVEAVSWGQEQPRFDGTCDAVTPARAGICYLLGYIFIFLGIARAIFGYHSWNFEWLPYNLGRISIFFFLFFNATIGPLFVMVCEVVRQIMLLLSKDQHLRPKAFLKDFLRRYIRDYVFKGALSYLLVYCTLIGYTNLKPTIPLLNNVLYDDILFKCDNRILDLLSFGGLCTIPKIPPITTRFDSVYFMLWPLACLTLLISCRKGLIFWRYTSAWCIAFGFSIPISILFPTLGPAFFKPELYTHISGTHTAMTMEGLLTHYRSFTMDPLGTPIISANGIVGMPSLHIALCYLSSLVIGEVFPRLRYLAWGLTLLFVVDTVYLGWHYLLDGVGGIALGWAAYRISTIWFQGETEIRPRADAGW
ncbi:phosphatase PAP2 family protein [Geomonas anaerohicana]|uniref:Phosphatase PAP2 family protein n=1 Tax=Geomonas anaerohicana TaxID=2798583 RepID=A0ABS0YGJ8_9BACT|nr:phosphatase PAP2 family protein [Geomonas anaerohicana]MBJ6751054.1 phosphatase PAP2 family protein [Geomonas anaerohicana]